MMPEIHTKMLVDAKGVPIIHINEPALVKVGFNVC